MLSWGALSDTDFDYATAYGSNAGGFGSAVKIDYGAAPQKDVTGSPYAYCFVTAPDFSGNEGLPARVLGSVGVTDGPVPRTPAVRAFPSPFGRSTTIRYGIPSPRV